jgi:hypothetical protein|tara:strand:+ start:83 stop:529 length:447 start_codon:yes stop_codon:yes gene_type:complete
MEAFKIGQHYDQAFEEMSQKEIQDNLEAIAYGLQETSYTKNLTEKEVSEKKDEYSQIGIELSELAKLKKEAMDRFKLLEKEPKTQASMLIESIKFKSEQKYGKLFLVDDQVSGMMYSFDNTGICVDARRLTSEEKQTKIKTLKTGTNE